ncbi:MAG: GAF domain-containing protein, partial [Chloroflexota bacterium]|nr:GAF domain-containing protein [Chloroflexota bacterium]
MDTKELQKQIAELEEARARADITGQINRRLNAARTDDELLQALTWPALEAGAFNTSLLYIDLNEAGEPEWGEVVATYSREGTQALPTGVRYHLPEFPFARMALVGQGEPIFIADAATDERMNEHLQQLMNKLGIQAIVMLPLVQAGRWVGFLLLDWDEAHQFSKQEMAIYRAIGDIAGSVVDNRRLAIRMQEALGGSEMLYEVSRGLNAARDEDDLLQILAGPAMRGGIERAELLYVDLDESDEPEWIEVVAAWQQEGESRLPVGSRFYAPEFPFA